MGFKIITLAVMIVNHQLVKEKCHIPHKVNHIVK